MNTTQNFLKDFHRQRWLERDAWKITLLMGFLILTAILTGHRVEKWAEAETKEMDIEAEYRQSITASYEKMAELCKGFDGKVVIKNKTIMCK